VQEAMKSNDLRRRLTDIGYESIGSSPAEFAAHIDTSIEKWRRIIVAGNIKPE
jgi:tripartite-type tricarboxylate transporter receptor subunit TctC